MSHDVFVTKQKIAWQILCFVCSVRLRIWPFLRIQLYSEDHLWKIAIIIFLYVEKIIYKSPDSWIVSHWSSIDSFTSQYTNEKIFTSIDKNKFMRHQRVYPIKFNATFLLAVSVVDGETLTITKVSRLHMGAYLCIASNGVPPSISKRIMLMVQCKYTYVLVTYEYLYFFLYKNFL